MPKGSHFEINGYPVEVHRDGGWLAFLPVTPGQFTFRAEIVAYREFELAENELELRQIVAEAELKVEIPKPLEQIPYYDLRIAGDFQPPSGDLVLSTGDLLPVKFHATPGMAAWFSIPGVVDSVPMSEMEPSQQPYWGESVFGAGAVPDSVLIRGIYSGFYVVPDSVNADTVSIIYHLAPPTRLIRRLVTTSPFAWADPYLRRFLYMPDSLSAQSGYRVSFNRADYPFTVRFTDSVQTIRYGPVLGYFSIFQPKGTEALVVGSEGDWYRLKLSHSQYAWASRKSVVALPPGILPPISRLFSIRTYSFDDSVLVEFPLKGVHPCRVIEDDPRNLRVQLFGVISNTDWIRYDFSDLLIELATWSQPEDRLYELKINLNQDLWGYDTYYRGNTFYLKLSRAPGRIQYIWGKTIVIDPGHSADPGAIGPTGLTEAQANLGIALELEKLLAKKGARVIMTRRDMSHVPLYDRPAIAKLNKADLFVSVHNNALPDGVNPFINNGVSTYYYHPHSIDLARAIQARLIKATGLPDHGLFHGNLAVNRPTQYPAVLVECAFMMIPEQEAKLKTNRYRHKVAEAITEGIEDFLEKYHDANRE
jgi:N-acetylmuramoyl-L-alanine amidase